MSSVPGAESKESVAAGAKTKKNKKKKGGKTKIVPEDTKVNGSQPEDLIVNHVGDDDDEDNDAVSLPQSGSPIVQSRRDSGDDIKAVNGIKPEVQQSERTRDEIANAPVNGDTSKIGPESLGASNESASPINGVAVENPEAAPYIEDHAKEEIADLRSQVASLRDLLNEKQADQEKETEGIREQLAEALEQKDSAEAQYENLLGKVNTIRSQLGERLKSDAEELSHARTRIDELEGQNASLRTQQETDSTELIALAENVDQKSKELSSLRNRTLLSQQNWSKEREDLLQREAYVKEEFEAAKQAMQDWEILAMEERSIREGLTEKISELEDQNASLREAGDNAASERESQSATVDGLQRALQEIQTERRRELREVVENSQVQIESINKQLQRAEEEAAEASKAFQSTKSELQRVVPFEKEVKEKNLLIGKLRHEAVILNDHLTKALRYLRRGRPEDSIDKQLITNHLMHFLALERGDPRKFQVLQIMSSLLGWTEEQQERAGLSRPGASNPNARVPVSPWHRTPSTPSLSTDFFPPDSGARESLPELWSGFLERQAQEDTETPNSGPSSSSGSRPP